jgi:hypothetical protein
MADLSITTANVRLKSAGRVTVQTAGESLVEGDPVYLATDNKWYRCDANDGAIKARCGGIALTSAAANGFFVMAQPGCDLDIGATLAVGETYVVSVNVGKIAPIGDLASSSWVTTLGVATATSTLRFEPVVSGVQKA